MADHDHDRDDDDDDDDDVEVESKRPAPAKAAAKPAAKPLAKPVSKSVKVKAEPVDENIALLREIRNMMRDAEEHRARYPWMALFAIVLLLLIAIFLALKL